MTGKWNKDHQPLQLQLKDNDTVIFCTCPCGWRSRDHQTFEGMEMANLPQDFQDEYVGHLKSVTIDYSEITRNFCI